MTVFKNLVEIPFKTAKDFPDRISHKIRIGNTFIDKTYKDLAEDIKACGDALSREGIKPGDHVSFFVCNRYEWLVCDFALMLISAVSVPRGSDTTIKEQHYLNLNDYTKNAVP